MAALGAGILGGAIGGGIAVTVLAPLTAANNFLGSYFFGSGMILGERQMYQDDWIKIKERLDKGESFLVILEEVMKPNTQAVMAMAQQTVIAVSIEWNKIVLEYIKSIPDAIWDALKQLGGETLPEFPLGPGVIGIVNGEVRCAQGWTKVGSNPGACSRDINASAPSQDEKNREETQQIVEDREQEEKASDIIEAAAEATYDKSIVGTGLDRHSLLKSVNYYENLIQALNKKFAIITKNLQRGSREWISQTNNVKNQIIRFQKIHIEYKKALSWVLKNRKPTE